MRLRRRVQLLLVIAFALVAANLALDIWLQRERDDVAHLVDDHLEPARSRLGTLLTALTDQETGQRGFIITGQERFLESYDDGGVLADAAIEELRPLLEDYPELQSAVQRVASRVSAWRQLGAEFEIEAKRSGRDTEAQALVATGTSKELFDRARGEVEDVDAAVRRELMRQEDRLDRFEDALTTVRLVGGAAALVMLAGAGMVLRRWVTDPLDRLRASVRQIAAGDLDVRVRGAGPPEIQELGADVEAMRRRILAELDDASRARAALARRGMVVLTLREDLAPSRLDAPYGTRIAAHFLPAEGVVAGDWYDAVDLGDGRAMVALVDVSGHGGDAAVFALRTKHLMVAGLRSGLSPGEAFSWLAGQLGETDEHFLTGVVVEMHGASGRIRYASAGHPALVVYDGGGVRLLGPTGPMLGPLPGRWATVDSTIGEQGVVVAYSDGLIEARDATGEEFGVERLVEVVTDHGHGDPQLVVQRFRDRFEDFRPVSRPDDTTLLVVARQPVADAYVRPLTAPPATAGEPSGATGG